MATGLLLDQQFTAHRPGPSHPESPERVNSVMEKLNAEGLTSECISIPFEEAEKKLLLLNHSDEYIERARSSVQDGLATLDSLDVEISKDSFSVASMAAKAACNAIDLLQQGHVKNAFLASRPPGHHAEYNRAMGFCLFNNVAIAARYAINTNFARKVFILDWDVHHGNGTQHSFEADPNVFYCSTHTNPAVYYPGTGFSSEIGKGEGKGFTFNIPLEPNTSERDYITLFENDVMKVFEKFNPDLLIISAGFDAHEADPLGNQKLTTGGFRLLSDLILAAADSICNGQVLSVLEGGYNLDALARSVSQHLESLVEHNS